MTTLEYVVNASGNLASFMEKAGLTADKLDHQLADLSKRVATPAVDLKDKEFATKMTEAAVKIDRLSKQVANPKITPEGLRRAELGILKLDAMLDDLDGKKATVTIDVDKHTGIFSRLFGGGGGGGLRGLLAGGPQGLGTGVAGLGGAGPYALGGLAALIATLAPALLPLGLGALAGGGAAGGALLAGSKAQADLLKLQTALKSAKGANRRDIRQQIAALKKSEGPELAVSEAGQNVFGSAFGTFLSALSARGPAAPAIAGRGGLAGQLTGPGPRAPSFLTSLMGILKQVAGFVKTLGPQLGDLFRASVPYLKVFVHFLEQAAKTLLPVFTSMLKQMQPFLPLISKGLMNIVGGLAGFLKAIGPSGMQASAKIFVVLTKIMAGVLVGVGHAINWLAEHVPTWAHNIAAWFDRVRHMLADWGHNIAVWFDRWRQGWAHDWDMLFQNTIGRARRGFDDITHEFGVWRHETAVIFDGLRHDIAHWWDMIWNNTVGRVERGIGDVVGFFKGLPGKVVTAIGALGAKLKNIGRQALTDLLNGLKSVWGSVWGWIKKTIGGIPHDILSFFHMSPPHPGSAFFDLGANFMHHLEAGMQSRAQKIGVGAIAGGLGARMGGSVTSWITAAIRGAGAPMSWLPALQRLVSLESGGNPRAVNPVTVMGEHATGLWQMLYSTFVGAGGRGGMMAMFNPVIEGVAALRYIMGRYGSPYNIPGLFSGGYRGYAYGTNSAAPGWAWVGERGPELVRFRGGESVTPAGGGAVIQVHVSADASMHPAETGRIIADNVKAYLKRGGTLYPAGMKPR